jgi:hypothetical protein
MTREEIDRLWQQALTAATRGGELYARYHFADMLTTVVATDAAKAEREAICSIVYGLCISDNNAQEIVNAIRARGSK